MLLKKLTFDNYKTYYGVQEVDLYIPEKERKENGKNIILLGGLNGAGKTTILKAILYILFGKRGMSEVEYKRLFSNVINNTFYNEGGKSCSVSLSLELDSGEEWTLKVKWYFDHLKRLTHEERSLDVKKTGSFATKHARIDNIEVYNRYIDKIIPYHAAPFFIFDGEEIKDIILRQNSHEMKEAIHKITGMESYKLLLNDLKSMRTSIQNQLARSTSRASIKNDEAELQELNESISKFEDRKNLISQKKQQYEKLIIEAKKERNDKLIHNSKSREAVLKKQTKVATELELVNKDFASFYSENVITIILGEKLHNLKTKLKEENQNAHNKIIQKASLTPYRNFMDQLLKMNIHPPLTEEQVMQINGLGEEIWKKENAIKSSIDTEEIHDISNKEYSFLTSIPIKDKQQVIQFLNRIEKLSQEFNELDNEIRNAPDTVNIEEENNKIDLLTKSYGEIDSKYKSVMLRLNKLNDQRTNLKNKFTRLSGQDENTEELQERYKNVDKTIAAMEEYVTEVTKMKAEFIRAEFAKMLKILFRKQDEFGKIEFDINTYSIRLYSDLMQEISIQERSAGEMQMISSSLIWALTKASDLSLPMVIDTPLGRLDSYHRNHLINHYYKELGEQVIILSTDTEITEDYIKIMQDASYRQYMLDYDENKKYTIIRDGYFDFVRL
ncbi:DNA sulfur modification protein DndD [Metabacillus sp. RGM 3146]|uniref:DNA sulfur modification protein DndD n=1 Tax=Metabacillus sp. RGM 3146 TaxID=3401092 RepID=UPI003B9B9CF6